MNLKKRLDVVQRRMVRFIEGMDMRAHVDTRNLFSLSWLSVPDRVAYFQMIHLFKIRNDLAPSYLRSNFTRLDGFHSYGTRGSDANYHISREISMAPDSFVFTAIRCWNSLPVALKSIASLNHFKRKLREHFLSGYT